MNLVQPQSDIDLFSDEVLYYPYDAYRQLRDTAAAVYMTQCDAWALPRYDDVRAALSAPERHSSANGVAFNEPFNEGLKPTILCVDGHVHDTMRSALSSGISPKALRGKEDQVRDIAGRYVDDVVQKRTFDAIADLAQPFPVAVIVELVGFPTDRIDRVLSWADAGFQCVGPMNKRYYDAQPLLEEMFAYLMSLKPEDFEPGQVGRRMFEAADSGELPPEHVIPLLNNFTGPAMDTTISAIGHAIWRFAKHPDQWAAVREDRSLIPSAVLEALRMDAPIQIFSRQLTQDTSIGGIDIPAGARTMMMYGSANRDERHYPDPDRFDVRRNPIDHLSFGYGVHSCVGQGLARLDAHVMLNLLADRVQRFVMADEVLVRPRRRLNNSIRSIESLPVTIELA